MCHFSCLFLLGTGSVLTTDGKIEMDAMIMEGEALRAGSVACVQNIAHPVSLARMVMEKVNYITRMQSIAHPVHLSRMVMLFSPFKPPRCIKASFYTIDTYLIFHS